MHNAASFLREQWIRVHSAGVVLVFLFGISSDVLGVQQVPLSSPETERNESSTTQVSTPLEMLELLGVAAEEFEKLADGQPMSDSERFLIYRVLFLLPRFEASDVARWQQPMNDPTDGGLEAARKTPKQNRVNIYSIQGTVKSIRELQLDGPTQSKFKLSTLYELQIEPENEKPSVIVWSRQIPNSWKQKAGQSVDFAARCNGFFLKTDEQQRPFVIAQRISWMPARLHTELGIHAEQRLLGALGVDVGRLDQLKHSSSLKSDDRDSFYQFLQAVGKVQPVHVKDLARNEFDILKLLGEPKSQTGLAYQFEARARRAIRILVDDQDIQKQFGIDHYYEVHAFISLPRPLTLIDPETDHKVGFNEYPIVFCVRALPDGMREGNSINQTVRLTGFYFKLWAFRNERMVQNLSANERKRIRALQKAPLFMGLVPELVRESKTASRKWEIYAGFIFIGMLILAWLAVMHFTRQDKKFESERKRREPPVDLANLDR